jgi:GR25 family glycosyltransferase involved in LPS biosynthesis
MISYCINLPERPEKWAAVQGEFKHLRGNVIKWAATKDVIGFDGCRKSHLGVLDHHVKNYPDSLCTVYEDDLIFCVNNPQDAIDKAMADLPKDWDMLYLGATLNQNLEPYGDNLYRLKKAFTTHAMIFNNQNGVIDFILEHNGGGRKIDVFYADVIQEQFNCYIAYPMIANQRNGFSDILNKNVNNGNIIQDYYRRHTR